MLGAIKNIMNMVSLESGNLAGSNVNGYKNKTASMDSSGNGFSGIGNDLYTKTDFRQGSLAQTGQSSDLAIQGDGFFVLFDDGAKASFDPKMKLDQLNADKKFSVPITNGTFTVNGIAVTVNTATDSFNDVLNKINVATGGQVFGNYDQAKNELTLTNITGVPGANVTLASGTSNFLDVSEITNSALQQGAGNNNYKISALLVGQVNQFQNLFFTRKGDFNFDTNGFLVNSKGLYVAGLDKNGSLIKIDKKAFDGTGAPGDTVHFESNGVLFNDTQLVKEGKKLALAKFPNNSGLTASQYGGELLTRTANAGQIEFSSPDSEGFGLLKDQNLEQSNASPVDSLTNLGLLQKFFPSTTSALKVVLGTQDDMNKFIT